MNLIFNYGFIKHYIAYLCLTYLWVFFLDNNYLDKFHWHLLIWWVVGVITAVIYAFKRLNEKVAILEIIVTNHDLFKEVNKKRDKENEKDIKE